MTEIADSFEAPQTVAELVFEEDKYKNLRIEVRLGTLDEMFEFDRAATAINAAKDVDAVEKAFRYRNDLLVRMLVSWNLTRAGEPIPITVDEIGRLEAAFVTRMIGAWRSTLLGVPAPLDKPSKPGETPSDEVESTLMAIPSESLAS